MCQKHDFLKGVSQTFFHLPTDNVQIASSSEHRHQLGSTQRKLKVKVVGQRQMGQKFDFLDGEPHNFFIYKSIMPKLHQQVFIDTSLDEEKKLRVKVKGQGQMGQKHIFFRQCNA